MVLSIFSIKLKFSFFSILIFFYILFWMLNSGSKLLFDITRVILVLYLFTEFICNLKLNKQHIPFVLWICVFSWFCFISIFWALDQSTAKDGAFTFLWNAICSIMIYLHCCNKREQVNCVLSILKYIPIMWIFFIIVKYGFFALFNVRSCMYGADYNRAGLLSAFATIVSYYTFYETNDVFIKKKEIIFIILNIIVCLITTSRKAMIIILVGFLVRDLIFRKNIICFLKHYFKFAFLFVVAFIIIKNDSFYVSVVNPLESMFRGVFVDVFYADDSTAGRLHRISRGIEWFKSRIWLGYGTENYSFLSGVYKHGFNGIADNNYIELLVDFGLVGFILYYSFIVKQLVSSYILYQNSNEHNISLILLVCILIIDFGASSYKSAFSMLIISICSVSILNVQNKQKIVNST